MNYEIELRLPALTGCLHVVDACVRRLCRTALGNEDQAFQDAVHTACVYSIEHAYGGDDVDHRLELSFAVARKELSVMLMDTGAATNALHDPGLAAAAARIDEAVYERLDATNTLRLVRRSAK